MSHSAWEQWVARALRGERLREPSEQALQRAIAAGKRTGTARPGSRLAFRSLAVAALLVAGVAGLFFLVRDTGPALPDRPEHGVQRGARIELIAPLGAQAAAPSSASWNPVDGAAGYRVTVVSVSGAVLFEGTTLDTSIDLPESLRSQLLAAVSYEWRVEADGHDGSVVARSEWVRFRIEP